MLKIKDDKYPLARDPFFFFSFVICLPVHPSSHHFILWDEREDT